MAATTWTRSTPSCRRWPGAKASSCAPCSRIPKERLWTRSTTRSTGLTRSSTIRAPHTSPSPPTVVILTPTENRFLTDSRYTVQAGEECPGFQIRTCSSSAGMLDTIVEQIQEVGLPRLAFESDHVTVASYEKWREQLPEVEWLP